MRREMTPEQFRAWRKSHQMTQADAAKRLGLSKRSIFTYEGVGPVPQVVALACDAITSNLRAYDFGSLVKEQHPKIGEFVIVIPYIVERDSSYAEAVETGFSAEAEEWARENTPSAKFSMRTVITPDMKRRLVAVITFETSSEVFFFKLRWC